jgi:hypothetical protein
VNARAGRFAGAFVALLIVAACSSDRSGPSPFELWTLRAGDSLATVADRVRRLGKGELACASIVGPTRYCTARSPGAPLTAAPGSILLLVDSVNRITLIQFRRDNYVPPALRTQMTSEWNVEVRTLSTKWEALPRVGSSEKLLSSYRMQRWLTSDSGWSAEIRYDPSEAIAQSITLSDERALRVLEEYSPLASYALSQRGLVGEMTDIPPTLLNAMASREGPSMTLASPRAVEISQCELELADVVIRARPEQSGGEDPRAVYGAQLSAIAEAAVPVAYPGWRLTFGQHVYLVSPERTAERVNLRIERDYHSMGLREGEEVYAIAIQRPRRAESARRRLEALDPAAQCSSRDDVIFVRRAADGAIAESVRIPIDEEAPLSEVAAMNFAPTVEGRGALVVSYVSAYGTDTWSGDLEWRAQIASDPPRVIGRTPVSYRKQRHDGPEGKGIMLTRLTGDTLSVTTLEESKSGVATQALRIVLGAGKVLSGVKLLEQLH